MKPKQRRGSWPRWGLAAFLVISAGGFRSPLAGEQDQTEPKGHHPGGARLPKAAPGTQEKAGRETSPESGPAAPLSETVVVTAARTPQLVGDATSLVSVLTAEELSDSPSLLLDRKLSRIPGFSLFRRSSSLTSHPTTQGVSLRGIGPSGASRTLVLFDGIPLNDPFGGWVYWDRIPIAALERVEVSRGAASQLYGSSALGGAIQLITRQPKSGLLDLGLSGGHSDSFSFEGVGGGRHGDLGYLAAGSAFGTEGVWVVRPEARGTVDTPAFLDYQSFLGRVDYRGFQAGVNLFHERRGNGTQLQRNRTELALFETGYRNQAWDLRFYTQSGVLESQFSRILPDRNREIPTAFQQYRSEALGASATVQAGGGLVVGSDWRLVRWEAERQNLWGGFLQELLPLHRRVDLQLGLRLDLWENRSVQTSINPRAGLLIRAGPAATLRASVYRGFRAPTLNELYRPFRVGNVVTEANPDLGAERLWGFEGGVDYHPRSTFLLRLNAFRNRLDSPVSNVTLSVSNTLITRQRRNLGYVDVNGLEIEGVWRPTERWRLEGGYLLSVSQVSETGLRLPQAPLNQLSLGVGYAGPVQVELSSRFIGAQFEDDLNAFRMGGFGLLGLSVRRRLATRVEAFLSVDNLLNRGYVVGMTPLEKLGEPRMVFGGLRLRLMD